MRDYDFGNFIYNLRKEKGFSQNELGSVLGVTNKAVSKWETGESKPALKQLLKLSEIFNVPINEFINFTTSRNKNITKIVITGGPCAGKSTALSWIQEEFTKRGYNVIFVPEAATEVILAGVNRNNLKSVLDFQMILLKNQIEKERLFEQAALKFKNNNKVLIEPLKKKKNGKISD